MPELPEVETVARGLQSALPGRRILGVHFGKVDFVDDPAAFDALPPGTAITRVKRLGKFICVELKLELTPDAAPDTAPDTVPDATPSITAHASSSLFLIVHLGMTGQLTVTDSDEPVLPHTHVTFNLDNGRELRYKDARRFGRMMLLSQAQMKPFRERLGAEPLDISREKFLALFQLRRTRVKALLLDQQALGGMGNIYADESLFRARIHPARIAASLSKLQIEKLRLAMREVLTLAILFRGSSMRDYVDAKGRRGAFQRRHRVYRRTGKPCLRCKTKIRRIVVAGRSTHFCPRCQPAPKLGPKPANQRSPKK